MQVFRQIGNQDHKTMKNLWTFLRVSALLTLLFLVYQIPDKSTEKVDTGIVINTLASSPRSKEWSKVRDAWIKENHVCAACGGTENLQVHHVKPFQFYPELELDPTNFITLCEKPSRNCHLNIGHSGDWKAWNPNVVEDAKLMLKRRNERSYEKLPK